jgi:hypothetical protein
MEEKRDHALCSSHSDVRNAPNEVTLLSTLTRAINTLMEWTHIRAAAATTPQRLLRA